MKYFVNTAGFISVGGKKIPYTQFYEEAFALADFLGENGVADGMKVVVGVDKSLRSLRNIVAVVICGGVFIPVEKDAPQSFIQSVINENSAVMLAEDCLSCRNGEIKKFKKPRLYGGRGFIAERDSDSPLYIIYTSGTSKKKKGVIITAGNLANYLNWFEREFSITEKDRTFLATSLAFDLSYTAVFSALKRGASLYLPKQPSGFNAAELAELITQNKITYLKLTPSIIRMLIGCGRLGKSSALRLVLSGGENINTADVFAFRALTGDCAEVVNHYGPTETTIGCCFKKLNFSAPEWQKYCARPSIGNAIDNVYLRILDNYGNEITQKNTAGQLVIGGKCVGKGYADGQNGGFVGGEFASGDLAAYNDNGEIVLSGRKDDIVKYNGYLLSTGDIQRAIDDIKIWEAAVCFYDKKSSQIKIFYVSDENPDYLFIYNELRCKLPRYMTPTYYARVPEIPCTANGKTDFAKLNAIQLTEYDENKTVCGIEKLFYGVLAECRPLGTFDYYRLREKSFSELGLSSLDIVEIFSAVEERFKVVLDAEAFGKCGNIEQCCRLVEARLEENSNDCNAAQWRVAEINCLSEFESHLSRRIDSYRASAGETRNFLNTQKYYYINGEQTDNVLCSVFKAGESFLNSFVRLLSAGCVFRTLIDYKTQSMRVLNSLPDVEIPRVPQGLNDEALKLSMLTLAGNYEIPFIIYLTDNGEEEYLVCVYKHAFILFRDFSGLERGGSSDYNRLDDRPQFENLVLSQSTIPHRNQSVVLQELNNFSVAQKNAENLIFSKNPCKKEPCSTGPISIERKISQPVLAAAFAALVCDFYKLEAVPLKIFINNLPAECSGLSGDHTDFAFTAIDCRRSRNQTVRRISGYLTKITENNINSLAAIGRKGLLGSIPKRTFYVNTVVSRLCYEDNFTRYIKALSGRYKKSNIKGAGLYSEYNADTGVTTVFIGCDFAAAGFIDHCKANLFEVVRSLEAEQ